MVSGGMSCVKYLLFVFNLIFAISGIAILTVGAIIQDAYADYTDFLQGRFFVAPVLLIVVGVIVFVVAFFGCCGAAKENYCMMMTFAALLLIVFILELAGGIAGYVLRQDVENVLEKSLNKTLIDYPVNRDYAHSWDIMQNDFGCCGIMKPEDWNQVYHNTTLPQSCCPELPKEESCTNQLSKHNTIGCLDVFKDFLVRYAVIIGGVGIGIGCVQLIGVIFACCLAKSIRKEYETV